MRRNTRERGFDDIILGEDRLVRYHAILSSISNSSAYCMISRIPNISRNAYVVSKDVIAQKACEHISY